MPQRVTVQHDCVTRATRMLDFESLSKSEADTTSALPEIQVELVRGLQEKSASPSTKQRRAYKNAGPSTTRLEHGVVSRGKCGVCSNQVSTNQIRVKSEDGAMYYHADCFNPSIAGSKEVPVKTPRDRPTEPRAVELVRSLKQISSTILPMDLEILDSLLVRGRKDADAGASDKFHTKSPTERCETIPLPTGSSVASVNYTSLSEEHPPRSARGHCAECQSPVFADHKRVKTSDGYYLHKECFDHLIQTGEVETSSFVAGGAFVRRRPVESKHGDYVHSTQPVTQVNDCPALPRVTSGIEPQVKDASPGLCPDARPATEAKALCTWLPVPMEKERREGENDGDDTQLGGEAEVVGGDEGNFRRDAEACNAAAAKEEAAVVILGGGLKRRNSELNFAVAKWEDEAARGGEAEEAARMERKRRVDLERAVEKWKEEMAEEIREWMRELTEAGKEAKEGRREVEACNAAAAAAKEEAAVVWRELERRNSELNFVVEQWEDETARRAGAEEAARMERKRRVDLERAVEKRKEEMAEEIGEWMRELTEAGKEAEESMREAMALRGGLAKERDARQAAEREEMVLLERTEHLESCLRETWRELEREKSAHNTHRAQEEERLGALDLLLAVLHALQRESALLAVDVQRIQARAHAALPEGPQMPAVSTEASTQVAPVLELLAQGDSPDVNLKSSEPTSKGVEASHAVCVVGGARTGEEEEEVRRLKAKLMASERETQVALEALNRLRILAGVAAPGSVGASTEKEETNGLQVEAASESLAGSILPKPLRDSSGADTRVDKSSQAGDCEQEGFIQLQQARKGGKLHMHINMHMMSGCQSDAADVKGQTPLHKKTLKAAVSSPALMMSTVCSAAPRLSQPEPPAPILPCSMLWEEDQPSSSHFCDWHSKADRKSMVAQSPEASVDSGSDEVDQGAGLTELQGNGMVVHPYAVSAARPTPGEENAKEWTGVYTESLLLKLLESCEITLASDSEQDAGAVGMNDHRLPSRAILPFGTTASLKSCFVANLYSSQSEPVADSP